MSYNDQLQANNEALQAILNKVNNLPDAGSGGSGGGESGGVIETCTVTVNLPAGITILAWGDAFVKIPDYTMDLGACSLPNATDTPHTMAFDTQWIFSNMPIGSVIAFSSTSAGGTMHIVGAATTDNIEFSLINDSRTSKYDNYTFAICKCNGDGEITIQTN